MSQTFSQLAIQFGSVKLFPSPYRPRVIVLDVVPQEQLAELARRIGQGILATNYEIDDRPFRAHLTIGRIKHPHGLNLSFLSEFSNPNIEHVQVNEVVLFRSEPQEDGSMYTILEKLSLSHLTIARQG